MLFMVIEKFRNQNARRSIAVCATKAAAFRTG